MVVRASITIDLEKLFARFDDTRAPVKALRMEAEGLRRDYQLAQQVLRDAERGVTDSSLPSHGARLKAAQAEFNRAEAAYEKMIAEVDKQLARYRR